MTGDRMTEMTIERVRALLEKTTPGGWTYDHPGGHYKRGGEIVEEYSALYEIGHDDGTVAHDIVSAADAELLSFAPDLARLALALDAQLQQEREGRERLESLYEPSLDNRKRLLSEMDQLRESLNVLWLKWGTEQTEYPDTEVGRHAAALLRLCVQELRNALQSDPQAQAGEGL